MRGSVAPHASHRPFRAVAGDSCGVYGCREGAVSGTGLQGRPGVEKTSRRSRAAAKRTKEHGSGGTSRAGTSPQGRGREPWAALGPDGLPTPPSRAGPRRPEVRCPLPVSYPATRSNALAGRKVRTRSTTSARLLNTKVLRGSAEGRWRPPPPPTGSIPPTTGPDKAYRGSEVAVEAGTVPPGQHALSRRARHFRPVGEAGLQGRPRDSGPPGFRSWSASARLPLARGGPSAL